MHMTQESDAGEVLSAMCRTGGNGIAGLRRGEGKAVFSFPPDAPDALPMGGTADLRYPAAWREDVDFDLAF